MNDRQRETVEAIRECPGANPFILETVIELLRIIGSIEEDLANTKKKSSSRRLALKNLNKAYGHMHDSLEICIHDKSKMFSINQELLRKIRTLEASNRDCRAKNEKLVDTIKFVKAWCDKVDRQYCNGQVLPTIEITKEIRDRIDLLNGVEDTIWD